MKSMRFSASEKRAVEKELLGLMKTLRIQTRSGIRTVSADIELEGLKSLFRRVHDLGRRS